MKKIIAAAAVLGLIASASASLAADAHGAKASTSQTRSAKQTNNGGWQWHAPAKPHFKGKFVPS